MGTAQAAIGVQRALSAPARRRLSPTRAPDPVRLTAARRAARTGVVTLGAFALGRWALGSVTAAVFATFTALAITGIADYGGSMLGRTAAVTVTVCLAIGLVALGTWISDQDVLVGCAVMFAVVATIALCGLLGGYAAAGSNALILFYVVAAGSPAAVAMISDRIEGVALGGALALAAAVALWPEPEHPHTLRRLGDAAGDLAARLTCLAGGSRHAAAPPPGADNGLRTSIDALADRPSAPTSRQRGELYLLNDLERLSGLVAALEQAPPCKHGDRRALAGCARTLSGCGRALRGSAATTAPDPVFDSGASSAAPFTLTARVAAVTRSTRSHTAAALGHGDRGLGGSETWPPLRIGLADLVHGARRFRAHLTFRSVHVHDALRLGAGLALAAAAVDAFGLQHGFWVAFATLTVIKSNLRATGRNVGEAIAGTVLGVLVAFALIAALEPSIGWYLVLLPIVIALAIYANVAISFLAGQAGFTLAIVVLFNLLGPAGWRIGIVRIVDVGAGALDGLIIGALAWPRGASATIGSRIADLVDEAAAHLAAAARQCAAAAGRTGSGATRQSAADAAVRAESGFAQYLTEHPPARDVAAWAHWLATGNRLWYAADLIASTPDGPEESGARTEQALERLVSGYASLARRLRHDTVPPQARAAGTAVGGDLSGWLEDLARASRLAVRREDGS